MKENKKLISEIIEEVKRDMSDEEILSLLAKSKVSKNTNSEESTKYTLGQKAADKIAGFAGSWAFIFAFVGVLLTWMVINIIMASNAFDPYPFILLNLVLSCVAAIQAPLIMMSQNRQEQKDRTRAENDYKVNLKTEIMIEDLHDKLNKILERQCTDGWLCPCAKEERKNYDVWALFLLLKVLVVWEECSKDGRIEIY